MKKREPEPKPRDPFGTGWLADAPDERDFRASARFGAPANLPREALALADHVRRVRDQGPTSACVGFAITSGVDVRLRKLGIEWPEPSPVGVYTPARRAVTPKGQKLDDGGSFPRVAMKLIRDVGIPSEQRVPFNPATINDDLKWGAFQDASKLLVFQWFRVYEAGASRSDAVANALAAGYPVVLGAVLDPAFFQNQGETVMTWGPERRGGHMLCVVGYRTRADGSREFLVLNSWGKGWGAGGFFWLHADALASDRVSDIYALVVAA